MARTTRNKVKSPREVAYTKERMALKRIMKTKYATMTDSEKEKVDERIKANKIEKLYAFKKTTPEPKPEPVKPVEAVKFEENYDEFLEDEAKRLAAEAK
jgi:hypothetical protein